MIINSTQPSDESFLNFILINKDEELVDNNNINILSYWFIVWYDLLCLYPN